MGTELLYKLGATSLCKSMGSASLHKPNARSASQRDSGAQHTLGFPRTSQATINQSPRRRHHRTTRTIKQFYEQRLSNLIALRLSPSNPVKPRSMNISQRRTRAEKPAVSRKDCATQKDVHSGVQGRLQGACGLASHQGEFKSVCTKTQRTHHALCSNSSEH